MMDGEISSSSTNYSLVMGFTTRYQAGTVVTVEDSDGTEILKIIPEKVFSSVTFSAPSLKEGSTYAIKINGTIYATATLTSITTKIGTQNNGGPRMMDAGGHSPGGGRH